MSGRIPSTQTEADTMIGRLREEGRQEGRRETLLELVRDLRGAAAADELASIDDLDVLEARVRTLLRRS
jgi:hypothetical protein